MLNNVLNFRRTGQLLIADLRIAWFRSVLWLLGLLAFCFFFFMLVMVDSSFTQQNAEWLMDNGIAVSKFHISFFPAMLLISGFIFSSFSFSELNRPSSKQFYLSLPANTLEKWVSKWVLSALFFPLLWILSYQLFAQYTYQWFRGIGFEMVRLPLTDPWIWRWLLVYVLLQSFIFLGAVWMPKFTLLKTGMVLAVLVAVCTGMYYLGIYTVLPAWSGDFKALLDTAATDAYFLRIDPEFKAYLTSRFLLRIQLIFGLFFFPLALLISYLKLVEKQS